MPQPHFPLTAWADFHRSTAASPEATAMQQHLDSGCQACQHAAGWVQAVAQFWRAEPANTPPPSATHFVFGSFAWARPRASRPPGRITLASLLGGPHLPGGANLLGGAQALAAGLRGGPSQAQHAAYRAGGWVVDVHLEPAPAAPGQPAARHLLSGQILHAADPLRRIPDAPVSVRAGSQVLAVTATNDHGEFQFELPAPPSPDSHIEIHLTGGNNQRIHDGAADETIVVPLRILRGPSTAPMHRDFSGDSQ